MGTARDWQPPRFEASARTTSPTGLALGGNTMTTTTTMRPTTVDGLVDAVLPLLDMLAEAADPVAVPPDAETLLRAAFTDRGGHLRQRSSLKAPTARLSAFAAALRFHSGANMGMFAPVMHSMTVGRRAYDEVDTVATVATLVLRGRSVGTEAWRRALGV
jgi:hypothetical protein